MTSEAGVACTYRQAAHRILLRGRDPGELLRLPAAARLEAGVVAGRKSHHEAPT